ncbi:MAG: hypothetical protein HQL19_06145 [Candidatus Omnitrophica bacterium]|nr:hypothetical protein [Candidatus Omnitrophota bacterium]
MPEKVFLRSKKNSKTVGVSSLAVHGSAKGGRFAGGVAKPSRAQEFLKNLKQEIKRAV